MRRMRYWIVRGNSQQPVTVEIVSLQGTFLRPIESPLRDLPHALPFYLAVQAVHVSFPFPDGKYFRELPPVERAVKESGAEDVLSEIEVVVSVLLKVDVPQIIVLRFAAH